MRVGETQDVDELCPDYPVFVPLKDLSDLPVVFPQAGTSEHDPRGEALGDIKITDFLKGLLGFSVISLIGVTAFWIIYRITVMPEGKFERLKRKFPDFM